MAFLAPIAGLIAVAVALPLLAALYFLKLRRRPVRVSSTLLWEQASHDLEVNAPFRMIRLSRSLLMHLLVLGLLCVAAARPTVEGVVETPEEVILVIDRSASMSARDANTPDAPTRLDRALRDAEDVVDRLPGDARVMVICYASEPTILSPLSPDLGQARRAVASIQATDQPGDLSSALRLVQAATRARGEGGEDGAGRRIVIFSDGDMERGVGIEPARLPEGTVEFLPSFDASRSAGENHAIVACDAVRGADDLGSVRVFCRVLSVNTPERELPITLRYAGRPVGSASVTLEPMPDSPGVYEGSHTFEFDDGGEGGPIVVSHTLDDALAADNAFGLVVSPPIGPGVMLVHGETPALPLADALAVPSLGLRALEEMTIGEYEARVPTIDGEGVRVAPVLLGDGTLPDLVIFDRCSPGVMPACPSVSFAGTLPIGGLNIGSPREGVERVTFTLRTHPLMRYTDLGDLEIRPVRPLTLPDGSGESGATHRTLAVGVEGPLIAQLRHEGVNRVILSFAVTDSAWWRRPGFPRFVKNALDTLTETGVEQAGRSFTTTESIAIDPIGSGPVPLEGPIERMLEVDPSRVPTVVLPRAGVYRVTGGEPGVIAVNLASSDESSIRVSSTLDLPGQSIRGGSAANIAPREIWHWFVLAAFILLCIEWFDYAWKTRI